jgi:hypothetical protein
MYKDYLTENDIAALIAMREDRSDHEWGIGEFVLQRVDLGEITSGQYGMLCKAIGAFVGMRSKDVREIVRVADWGGQYKLKYPNLTFEHFRRAAKMDNGAAALEWADKQQDELGRPASVDALLAVYGGGEPKPEAAVGSTPGAVVAVIKHATGTLRRVLNDKGKTGLLPYLDEIEKAAIGDA